MKKLAFTLGSFILLGNMLACNNANQSENNMNDSDPLYEDTMDMAPMDTTNMEVDTSMENMPVDTTSM